MDKALVFALISIFVILSCNSLSSGGSAEPGTIKIQPPTPVEDYQVLIKLAPTNFLYKGSNDTGEKLVITDIEGNPLAFWIERWFANGISLVWVKIPQAGTEKIKVFHDYSLTKSLSDPFLVFDPISLEEFQNNWLYSGGIRGRVSGQEALLMNFYVDTSDWERVNITEDYANGFDQSRWFVRKEFFIAPGTISFSGWADDDAAWTLIASNEIYQNIGGDLYDGDGLNPHRIKDQSFEVSHFDRYIWAGRGQDGTADETLTISELDSGIDLIYTRKYVNFN